MNFLSCSKCDKIKPEYHLIKIKIKKEIYIYAKICIECRKKYYYEQEN